LQEPTPPGKVEVLTYAPGFDKARTDADLAQLYRDNLDPDLAPFKRAGGISIQEFKEFVTVGSCGTSYKQQPAAAAAAAATATCWAAYRR
jgi:hypothetical protein